MIGLLRALVSHDTESKTVLAFIERARARSTGPFEILDVGCGRGRFLRELRARNLSTTGVDASEALVAENRKAGFSCLTPGELAADRRQFDCILMSHVVEHLAPADLLAFLDAHLDRLRTGGSLIIATPLLSPYFYDDFDHVRPYQPTGLLMVFGPEAAQVQYQSRNKLSLEDLRFRRSPFRFTRLRAVYIPSPARKLLFLGEVCNALLFHLTFGLLGRTDGWAGVFRKL